MTILLSKHAGGGEIYHPPMMKFDGSSYYTMNTLTTSGNKVIMFGCFRYLDYTGDTFKCLASVYSAGYSRGALISISTDYVSTPTLAGDLEYLVANNAGVAVCRLVSAVPCGDGELHTFFAAYDGDNGTAVFIIDGQDADDTGHVNRIAPTTATLATGASSVCTLGALNGSSNPFVGEFGFFGYHDTYTEDYSLYFEESGARKKIDGSALQFFNPFGYMLDNLGTAGDLTETGTVVPADSDNSTYIIPALGLPTICDAVAADIAANKIAWVDGARIVGDKNIPTSLLLYHQFDGAAGALGTIKPQYCYDPITTIAGGTTEIDGSGYLVDSGSGGKSISIDPEGRWPSRSGKTRNYLMWGRMTTALVAGDYQPQIQFCKTATDWVCVRLFGAGNVGIQSYRLLASSVIEVANSTSLTLTAPYRWRLLIEDHGDSIVAHLTTQRESTENSDINSIGQCASHQLYTASRPYTEEQWFTLHFEGVRGTCEYRGFQVWDS